MIVTAVDQPSITKVNTFTLRTDASEELVFGVGTLDMTDGGFNAGHLREHMATSTAINVRFDVVDGERIANRLTDAEQGVLHRRQAGSRPSPIARRGAAP